VTTFELPGCEDM